MGLDRRPELTSGNPLEGCLHRRESGQGQRHLGLIVQELEVVVLLSHALGQRIAVIRQGDHREGFGEVGVGGGANQQPVLGLLLLAVLADRMTQVGIAAAGAQPGGAPLTGIEGIEVGDHGIGELAGDAAFGLDIDLSEVVAGTGLQQVEPLAVFAVELPEAEITPRDVAEVPVRASHHEANRHEGVLPAVIVLEPLPVIDATIAVVHKRAGTERAPVNEALGDLLGEGPLGEAQGLDRAAGLAEGLGGARRRAQLDMPHARGGAHQLQQPRLINNVAALGVPVIEATDHHGIAGQVDHGAGAVELLHLALADLPDRRNAAA